MTYSKPNSSWHDRHRSSTSASLLARVQADDSEAWGRLVRLYGPVVYRWARDAGLQPNDAADVTQDVFGALTRHIGRLSHERPTDTFRGWLWTITRNRVRDHYRELRQQVRAAGGTAARERLEQLADSPPDPHSESGSLELGGLRHRACNWSARNSTLAPGRPSGGRRSRGIGPATLRLIWA